MCNKGSYIPLGTRGLISDSHNCHRSHCDVAGAENQFPHSDLYMCAGHACSPPHTQLNVTENLDKHNRSYFQHCFLRWIQQTLKDFYKPGTGHTEVKLKGWEDDKRTWARVPSARKKPRVVVCGNNPSSVEAEMRGFPGPSDQLLQLNEWASGPLRIPASK